MQEDLHFDNHHVRDLHLLPPSVQTYLPADNTIDLPASVQSDLQADETTDLQADETTDLQANNTTDQQADETTEQSADNTTVLPTENPTSQSRVPTSMVPILKINVDLPVPAVIPVARVTVPPPSIPTALPEQAPMSWSIVESDRIERQVNKIGGEVISPPDRIEREVIVPMLEEYAGRATLHGMYQAGTPGVHLARRLIWRMMMMVLAVSLLYVLIVQLKKFLAFEVQTVISQQQKRELEFPAVTVCNHNQFRKTAAEKDPTTAKLLKELFSLEARLTRDRKNNSTVGATNVLNDHDLVGMAHQLEEMVIYCNWCGTAIPCSQFMSMTLTEVGVCYTFHSREVIANRSLPLLVHEAGSDCGLTMRFNIEVAEYYYGAGVSAGIQAIVHAPDEVPLVGQYGFSVPPGSVGMAAVQVRQNLNARSPYGDCVDTAALSFTNPLKYYDTYTATACKLENRVDFIYKRCKCRMYYDPSTLPICRSVDDVLCWMKAKENFTRTGLKYMREACPPTCVSMSYATKVSYAQFPAPHLIDEIADQTNLSHTDVSRNLLQLNVFFEEVSVRVVQQQPAYTATALFSDTGGLMGLCMGASLLTLVELGELLVLRVIRVFKDTCRHK